MATQEGYYFGGIYMEYINSKRKFIEINGNEAWNKRFKNIKNYEKH